MIENCTATAIMGGGICANAGASLSIGDGSILRGNRAIAADGGALHTGVVGTVTIGQNVVIEDNYAFLGGGGVHMSTSGTITIGNYVLIQRNEAGQQGGGFIAHGTSIVTIGNHAQILSNVAAKEGGVSQACFAKKVWCVVGDGISGSEAFK